MGAWFECFSNIGGGVGCENCSLGFDRPGGVRQKWFCLLKSRFRVVVELEFPLSYSVLSYPIIPYAFYFKPGSDSVGCRFSGWLRCGVRGCAYYAFVEV